MKETRSNQNSLLISKKPTLSLILCSRNDNYMGNPRWRLQTTLNYTAQVIFELGRQNDVEILVSDWGSQVPLKDAITLSPAAASLVSFIQVPVETARVLQKDSPFAEVLALNTAVRRSRGQYIGRIDQDTLVGERFFKYFFDIHAGRRQLDVPLEKALLFANRRSIPYRFAARCLPLEYIDRYVRLYAHKMPVWNQNNLTQNLFWSSYVGIWLLHRDLWDACSGYDERLIYYNWMETDMILRLKQYHPVIDLGEKTAYDFYHLEHYSPDRYKATRPHDMRNPDMDVNGDPETIKPNPPDWGLVDYDFEILPYPHAGDPAQVAAHSQAAMFRLSFNLTLVFTNLHRGLDAVQLFIYKLIGWRIKWSLRIWKQRLQIIRDSLDGRPVGAWPRLLVDMWTARQQFHHDEKRKRMMSDHE